MEIMRWKKRSFHLTRFIHQYLLSSSCQNSVLMIKDNMLKKIRYGEKDHPSAIDREVRREISEELIPVLRSEGALRIE